MVAVRAHLAHGPSMIVDIRRDPPIVVPGELLQADYPGGSHRQRLLAAALVVGKPAGVLPLLFLRGIPREACGW